MTLRQQWQYLNLTGYGYYIFSAEYIARHVLITSQGISTFVLKDNLSTRWGSILNNSESTRSLEC